MPNPDSVFPLLLLTQLGSIASVVGVGITVFVYFSVRKIRRELLFRARSPVLRRRLEKHASQLSRCLQSESDATTVKATNEELSIATVEATNEELSIAEVNLVSLYRKSRGSLRKNLKSLIRDIRRHRSSRSVPTRQSLRVIYESMNMIIQEIVNLREDTKRGYRDG